MTTRLSGERSNATPPSHHTHQNVMVNVVMVARKADHGGGDGMRCVGEVLIG